MDFLLAVSPIFVLIFLLLGLRLKMHIVSLIFFTYTAALGVWRWAISLRDLTAALTKGLFLTADILLIIIGAVIFLKYLKKSGAIDSLETLLRSLSPDRRVQAILLAWLFGSFIEGTSGFGTPAMVVAPLLVGIGFPAVTAILVCLTANSTAVAFGAVGTPIRIGFAGLDITGVPERAALINLLAGIIVPFLVVAFVVRSDPKNPPRAFRECVPWAFFSGLAFLLPYYLFSHVGFEFPSLFGSATALVLAYFSIRYKILLPKTVYRFSYENKADTSFRPVRILPGTMPYVLLLLLLLGGKFVFTDWKATIAIGQGLSHSFQIFNPGCLAPPRSHAIIKRKIAT